MLPVITISREAGSNGRRIGELVAQKLNIPIIDKFFVEELRERNGLSAFEVERKGEFLTQYDIFSNNRYYNGQDLENEQSGMYHIQRQIILEEIKKGPCVIIGRCADAILEEEGIPALNVFVHAEMEDRVKNYQKKNPGTESTIQKLLHRKDKTRSTYYQMNTDKEWGKFENYDLALNSSVFGEEFCADMIAVTAQKMEKKTAAA